MNLSAVACGKTKRKTTIKVEHKHTSDTKTNQKETNCWKPQSSKDTNCWEPPSFKEANPGEPQSSEEKGIKEKGMQKVAGKPRKKKVGYRTRR